MQNRAGFGREVVFAMSIYQKDKRSSKRVTYLCEVEYKGIGSRLLSTRITDLSTDGAFIDSMLSFPEGSILKLRFRVEPVEVNVSAEIRYCLPQIGMGVRFLDLTEADRARMRRS